MQSSSKPPNVLAQLLFPDEKNEMSLSLIKPFIGMRDIYMLSCAQKGENSEIYNSFFYRAHGQRLWIDIAVRVTADPSMGFEPAALLKRLTDIQGQSRVVCDEVDIKYKLFESIRALVCPWTSSRELLPLSGMLYSIPRRTRMFVVEEKEGNEYRLVFQSRDPEDQTQSSCPARSEYEFQSMITYSEPLVEMKAGDLDFTEEVQRRMLTPGPFVMPDFTIDRNTKHVFFGVHGGVFGVMEFHPSRYSRMNEGVSGIYFFDYHGRFLRHMMMPRGTSQDACSIVSRPYNMWFHFDGSVEHVRNRFVVRDTDHVFKDLGGKAERMAPALWKAARGDAHGAIEFMRRDLDGFPINMPATFNERTLLHYAAQEGQTAAVVVLLAAGAKSISRDFNGDTPLVLACERMRHEVVEILVKTGTIDERNIKRAWEVFCSMGKVGHETPAPTEAVHYHTRVQIPAITRCLLGAMEPSDPHLFSSLTEGFWCSDIVASVDAMRIMFEVGGNQIRDYFGRCGAAKYLFQRFRSEDYARESLATIRLVYGELRMDINRPQSIDQEAPLIWAIRKGTVDAVRMMIEELGADVTVRSEMGNGIRTETIMRSLPAVLGYHDPDGEMILKYLESRDL